MSKGKAKGFHEDEHDTLWFEDRVYVPNNPEIRKLILQEAHDSPYSIHPGNTKMYLDLKETFWWTGMKKDIASYVPVCDVCQRVKAEQQKPAGLLQPLPIPEWKWDKLGMDFITGLPKTRSGYDSIWVIVDRLTKVAHFIPVKTTYSSAKLAKIYMTRIVCLPEFRGVSYRIQELNLPQSFGISCMKHWEPGWNSIQLFTHRQMDRLRESIRFWRIC